LNREQLTKYIEQFGHKPYRAKQLLRWIYYFNEDHFEVMTDVAKSFQATLKNNAHILTPEIIFDHLSLDGTRKWLLNVGGKNGIETVFIPEEDRGTLCISSQVGCALECTFCSTGRQGFNRNLTSGEIIGQLWLANKLLRKQENYIHLNLEKRIISNVGMMGMGEPLLNFDNVMDAVSIMMHDSAYGLSKRKVTISTSGVVTAIEKMKDFTEASLAVSLHAPNDELRSQIMPINKKYPIAELLKAVRGYMDSLKDKRVPVIEYTLIKGVNDHRQHARDLAKLLESLPCKINLIPFNAFSLSEYKRPSSSSVTNFRQILKEAGYTVTVRTTRADDIGAACGQLVGDISDQTKRSARYAKSRIINA
jgi:23S rRNA (adenine2503-C2)-methyltransferase